MKEYYVHILNWAVEADSLEEAAKIAKSCLDENGGSGFYFQVSEKEFPDDTLRSIPIAEFDSDLWELEEDDEPSLEE